MGQAGQILTGREPPPMDPWQACLRLDSGNNDFLENGTSFERSTFDFSRFHALVLPEDAIVRRGLPTDKFNVYVEKTQAFKGWPQKKLAISEFRKQMGVAVRPNGQLLAIATYGEWETIEGGGKIRLTVLIPSDLEVKRRGDLSGARSMANSQHAGQVGPGPGYPKPGWTGFVMEPNAEMMRI